MRRDRASRISGAHQRLLYTYLDGRNGDRSQLLDDILAVATVGESRVTNAYKRLNEELRLPAKPATPTMYISRLASDLDCPERIRRRARALAEAVEDAAGTTGVHPAGFAAAFSYTAGQEAGG
nr:hypothetical protein [Halobellus ruber]